MSLVQSRTMRCPECGHTSDVPVADSIDGERDPRLRTLILERALHTYECEACHRVTVVEKALTYIDFARREYFAVFPSQELQRADERAAQVKEVFARWFIERAPRAMAQLAGQFFVRLCFGYEELREKLVVHEAKLSDLALEVLKGEVLASHPAFREIEVVALRLHAVADEQLLFHIELRRPMPMPIPTLAIERAHYDRLHRERDTLRERWPRIVNGPHVSLMRLLLP